MTSYPDSHNNPPWFAPLQNDPQYSSETNDYLSLITAYQNQPRPETVIQPPFEQDFIDNSNYPDLNSNSYCFPSLPIGFPYIGQNTSRPTPRTQCIMQNDIFQNRLEVQHLSFSRGNSTTNELMPFIETGQQYFEKNSLLHPVSDLQTFNTLIDDSSAKGIPRYHTSVLQENEALFLTNNETKRKPESEPFSRTRRRGDNTFVSQYGPIRASPPDIILEEATGEQFLAFSYSTKHVVTRYLLRCPNIDLNEEPEFPRDFLKENCVYPGAMGSEVEYKGKRRDYERSCNIIGWNLAYYNPQIRGCKGVIQRAVDSWRNTRSDPGIRSRRARKLLRRARRGT